MFKRMPFLDSEGKTTAAHQKHSGKKCFPSDFSFLITHKFLSTGKVCLVSELRCLKLVDFPVLFSSVPCKTVVSQGN